MDELKKVCTSCGSEKLAGPFRSKTIVWFGMFSHAASDAYVCLVCGHVEDFFTQVDIEKIRRKFDKNQG
ncbi:MAG: hypothetical protein ACFFEM_10510 [Candidatus Thorarchaeota archaeon]